MGASKKFKRFIPPSPCLPVSLPTGAMAAAAADDDGGASAWDLECSRVEAESDMAATALQALSRLLPPVIFGAKSFRAPLFSLCSSLRTVFGCVLNALCCFDSCGTCLSCVEGCSGLDAAQPLSFTLTAPADSPLFRRLRSCTCALPFLRWTMPAIVYVVTISARPLTCSSHAVLLPLLDCLTSPSSS